MNKLITTCKHKILWAQELARKQGVLYVLKQLPEALMLKREFLIYGRFVDEDNNKKETKKLPEDWQVVHNNFHMLKKFQDTTPGLPVEFSFGTIDGCNEFYMMVKNSNGEGEPMAIGWLYDNRCLNRVVSLRDDEVEIKHCVTMEKFRNCGVFSRLLTAILTDMKNSKYKYALGVIEINNTPSIRMFEKCGFTSYCKWNFRKFFGVRISPLFSTDQRHN